MGKPLTEEEIARRRKALAEHGSIAEAARALGMRPTSLSEWLRNNVEQALRKLADAFGPPDILVKPKLAHIGLMEFNRAVESIEEGRRAMDLMLPMLLDLLE